MRFSIIIVTWNAIHHLKQFLPSVAASDYTDFEIVIADNASGDETTEWIKSNYPGCKIVTYDRNYGYCGGNNRAVKFTDGDILIFLNNDAGVAPDWLQQLEKTFRETDAGIVQPKILSAKNRTHFEYAGAAGGMIDWLGYPFCRGRVFEHVEQDTGQYDEPAEIFWVSGAAFAIRREIFMENGGFDEDFEFHMEEIDFCWRCHKQGISILYQPQSVVYHLGGGSLPMGSTRKIFFNYRNSLVMLTKNLDRFTAPKIFLRLLLDGISGLRSLLLGKPKETLAIIRAHFAYYGMLGNTLKKRNELKKTATRSTPSHLVYGKLIIKEVFLFGKKTYTELIK